MPRSKSTKKIVINLTLYEKKLIAELAKKQGFRYSATFVKKIVVASIKKMKDFQ